MKSDSCFEDFAHLDKLHEFSKNRFRTLACIFCKTPVQMSTERVPHLWYCLRFVNMFQTMNCSIHFPTFYQKSKTWLIFLHLPNLWEKCQNSIDKNCVKFGLKKIHHDLTRLLFFIFLGLCPCHIPNVFVVFYYSAKSIKKNAKTLI